VKRVLLTTTVLCALGVFGCDKPAEQKTEPATSATVAATTATPAVTATATAEAIAEADLATPADFEEEMEKAVTAKNYKTELASLETEMAKD
jgi:phage shock protein A